MRDRIEDGQTEPEVRLAGNRCRGGRFVALLLFWLGVPVLVAAQASTITTLSLTANGVDVSSVDAGAAITLTAEVATGGKPVMLGQVNFCDATAKLCSDIHLLGTVQLNSAGTAALKFVPRAGTHSYKAEFVSTIKDAASVSTDLALVVYGATATTIAQSGSAGNYTLKATVTGQANDIAPAGSVQFLDTTDGKSVLASATLAGSTPAVTWSNTQNPATSPQPLSIVVADFNGDGIPDLAIGTNGTTTGYLNILLGNGNGTFQAAKTYAGLPKNQAMVAAPFVNGGPLDILTVDNNASGTNNAALFVGNGAGGGTLGTPFSLGGLAQVNGIAAADLNRDGSQDFVITGIIYGVWTFANVNGNGNGTFGGPTLNAVGSNPLSVVVGPFNNNGYPDIVVADSGVDQVTVFQNNGQGYFFPGSVSYNTGTTPVAMVTGDFNGDGFLDLAVVNNGSNNVSTFFGAGNETLTAGSTINVGHAPTSIAVGDFNGDGIADLAVVNSGDKTVSILLGKGDGTFVASGTPATGINPVNVAVGNFSGTGLSDLAVTNQDIASTTGSTLTVQAAQVTATATATATRIDPLGTGTHLVDASYVGDSNYIGSVSATTSLSGMLAAATAPVLSLAAGSYPSVQTVTITDSTYGAVVYYTTNGTTPTTASTKYTGAITIAASETIEAIAIANGFTNSAVATASYTITSSLALSAASLSYPTTMVGLTSGSQLVTLTNTGTAAVPITSIAVTGADASSFVFANSCGASLAAGASCTIHGHFAPAAVGALSAAVTLTDSNPTTTQTIALTGTGIPRPVTLSATSLAFGSISVGETSSSQSVTMSNTGTAALTISSIALTGTGASQFVFANNCGTTLAVGANCTIHGHFAPTAAGAKTAAITITDSASNSPQSISLTGTGVAPAGPVTLTAASLSFGSVTVGTSSASQYVTMTNTGTATLTITNIAVTGTNASQFVFANSCGTSLAVGASCSIHGHFAPTSTGAKTASVTITDSATGSPQTIALSGTGD